jgi:hypothetical protein
MEAFLAFGGRDITSPFPGLSIEHRASCRRIASKYALVSATVADTESWSGGFNPNLCVRRDWYFAEKAF